MALQFTKTVDPNKWLFADNNNIIEFKDDDQNRTPLHVDITIGTPPAIRIYPRPDNSFWFNLLEYIAPMLDDYDADLDYSTLDPSDIDTFVFDYSKIYFSEDIILVVTFDDGSEETNTLQPNFLLGAEQVIDFFKQRTISDKDVSILSKPNKGSKFVHYLKYWEGYPFDISYTKSISGSPLFTTVTNETNGIESPQINSPYDVNRLVISDGDTNFSLEDYVPLLIGTNSLKLDDQNSVELLKVDSVCGTYIRWINNYGTPNYWLFNVSRSQLRGRTSGVINNDFNNVGDSKTTVKNLGQQVTENKILAYDGLTEKDIDLLSGILLSPRVSLYVGERYSPNPSGLNWIDVTLANKNLALDDFKNRVPNGTLTINLPDKYTIKL